MVPHFPGKSNMEKSETNNQPIFSVSKLNVFASTCKKLESRFHQSMCECPWFLPGEEQYHKGNASWKSVNKHRPAGRDQRRTWRPKSNLQLAQLAQEMGQIQCFLIILPDVHIYTYTYIYIYIFLFIYLYLFIFIYSTLKLH